MNQLVNLIYTRLIVILLFIMSPVALSASLQIAWNDNSTNEEGFFVEKRIVNDDFFQNIAVLAANTTQYNDLDVISEETYCYRITAFNQAGKNNSEEVCAQVPVVPDPGETLPGDKPDFTGSVVISHETISKPVAIEIGRKTLYSFKSNVTHNQEYTQETLEGSNFVINSGKISSADKDYFSFQNEGVELENGYTSMKFDSSNSLSFVLHGTGNEQTARLYMQAGAWDDQQSSVVVTAGDKTQVVTLPKGYSWHFFAVDIVFDGTVPVHITTDSDRSGYSAVMFAGIVFDNANMAPVVNYAALVATETKFGSVIDTTDASFYSANGINGNEDISNAVLQNLSFYGKSKYRDGKYTFVNGGNEINSGYQSMSWKESNGVEIKLASGSQQVNIASVYFNAGVWSNDAAFIEIIINGESELVEVPSGYTWHYMKVDIEFEGIVDINIHPVGTFGSYSGFGFAGVTIQ
ncbi:fibronectin type III domain-containing protein [Psychromonas sp. MME2]|uniref:fibronectin type III domain-containing protein n=1 Tax=unclassified Psychromonas TaxID=2614957 RepID=UPI00339C4CF1